MERLQLAGHTVWRDALGPVEVRFIGKGSGEERGEILRALEPEAPPVAWAKQIHSGRHLPGQPGFCGEGDALISGEGGVALSVITADCVPVLVAGETHLAAIHAGWRGIVGRVVHHTLSAFSEDPSTLTAWIGPSIGACCYEVGPEVAEEVVSASTAAVCQPGPAGKPHLDLVAAVRHQLTGLGVGTIRELHRCTRCHPAELASYRREGQGAGRNLAVIWQKSE
jgi:YfiH family protein